MAETHIKDVKLKIGTESQFQEKLKDLPLNTLVGVTDPIQEVELDTSIVNKLNKAENALPKPTNDSRGTDGQVLKKTANGSEWSDGTPTTFKTLFGNKSIVGSGNIDLFNHDITIKGTDSSIDGVYEVHVFKTSSNNLKVDSLTDLKTLLGNTFKYWNVKGWLQNNLDSRSEMAIYVTESSVAFQSPTSSEYTISLVGATFTDDVTTV